MLVLAVGLVEVQNLIIISNTHRDVCAAIEKNRKFIRDTDRYILRHTTHPEDPAIRDFHKFLVDESQGAC